MRIAVLGTGYVGLVSGACLADAGHDVVCVDVDIDKVHTINAGQSPIHEVGLEEIIRRNIGKRLVASTDLRRALDGSSLTLIAVGTPFDGERIDLSHLVTAVEQVGKCLRSASDFHSVVVKSTVVPGTTDSVVRDVLEKASGLKVGVDVGLGVNPEFLTEGTAVSDFVHPDRIVLGSSDERTLGKLRELYAPFSESPVLETNNRTAEMVKYASNSLLATMISFANEIANLSAALGDIDAMDVMRGVHMSSYLSLRVDGNSRLEAPIARFLEPGCGFGGSCLPKDVSSLIAHGRNAGQRMQILSAVIDTNRRQPFEIERLLRKHFDQLEGIAVTVLGLSFKPDTDDVRETPALPIVRMLKESGASVRAYDPIAGPAFEKLVGPGVVDLEENIDDAIAGAAALIVVTRWGHFEDLSDRLDRLGESPVIIDGRRMLDKTRFNRYEGIGL